MAENFGGYDYKFVERNLERFTCTVCTRVLKDPHITKCCGQHFCESCLNYWFTEHRKESCLHCRAEGEEFLHFLDKKLKREIDSLIILCTNKEEGCKWRGKLESLKGHLEFDKGCGFVDIECPNKCETSHTSNINRIKRRDLANHLKTECYNRPYKCKHCGRIDKYLVIVGRSKCGDIYYIPAHYEVCDEFPLQCPNQCCEVSVKRKDMKDHRLQCPEEVVECTYKCTINDHTYRSIPEKNVPLNVTTMKRKFLKRHLKECRLRPFECEHCMKEGTYEAITTEHYDKCPEYPLDCPNKCGAKDITRKEMKEHRIQCPEENIQCSNKCQSTKFNKKLAVTTMKRKYLAKHLEEECVLRPFQCEHCAMKDTYTAIITEHYGSCPEFPEECRNNCGSNNIKRKDMKWHLSIECPEEPVQCPFVEAGCEETIVRRKMESHLSDTQQQHLLMVMGAYKEMKQNYDKLKDEYEEVMKRCIDIEEELFQTKHDNQELMDTLRNEGIIPHNNHEEVSDTEEDESVHAEEKLVTEDQQGYSSEEADPENLEYQYSAEEPESEADPENLEYQYSAEESESEVDPENLEYQYSDEEESESEELQELKQLEQNYLEHEENEDDYNEVDTYDCYDDYYNQH